MNNYEELKKAIKHIDHSRKTKADKLKRIEGIVINYIAGGYTDEFVQSIFDICREPEPVYQEEV